MRSNFKFRPAGEIAHVEDKQAIENYLMTGTEESFCGLFEAVYPGLRRYFLLRGIDGAEAEDLAQNVMVIVYRRGAEVRDKELFRGWLFKVAKNELARYWRQRLNRNRIAEIEPLSKELIEKLSIAADLTGSSNLQEWMSHLEPADRELVILRFVEELSYEELALAFGVPVGTVKWRIFNVKKKLIPIINASSPHTAKRIN